MPWKDASSAARFPATVLRLGNNSPVGSRCAVLIDDTEYVIARN